MTPLERNDLHAAIEQRYPDNNTELITPLLLREGLHELVDSMFVKATDVPPTGAVYLRLRNGKTLWHLGTGVRNKSKLYLRKFGTGTLPAILPAPVLDPNRPAIQAPGVPFVLHPSIGGAATGTAEIAEYTRQVADGDHFLLTGADLASAAYPVYRDGNFYATSVSTSDNEKAAVRLPRVGAAWDAVLAWASTKAGISLPILLNTATVFWGEDEAAEGLTISFFGRNLAQGNVRGGKSYLAVQPVGGGAVTLIPGKAVDETEARFLIKGLAKGVYKRWLHSGHGGEFGWSEVGTLTVVDVQDHVMTRNFGAPVFLALSKTDGVANAQAIANMFRTLGDQGGGCFETEAGDFPTSEFIYPRDKVKWQCRTAATGGRTRLAIPAASSWNPGDCMIASNSWTLGALDGIGFYKPDSITINVDALLIFNGSRHIRLDNVEATWKRPYDTVNVNGTQIPLNAQPLRVTNSQHVFINSCKLVGSGMHVGSRHNVGVGKSGINRQIFIRNQNQRMTNGADYTVYVQNTSEILIDGLDWQDLNPASDDGVDRGSGRGPKFGGQGGINRFAHVTRCVGRLLGPLFTGINPFYDRNQGENFLWEGNRTTWQKYIVSATATTLTFAQPVLSLLADVQAERMAPDAPAAGVLPGLHLLRIARGRGLWQVRGIKSVSGNTITLDKPLRVVPDTTSLIQVGVFADSNTLIDCQVSGKRNIVTDADFGILNLTNLFGGVTNTGVFDCASDDVRHGLIVSMTTHADGENDGCYFCEFRRVRSRGSRWGHRFQAPGHPGNLGWRYPTSGLGAILLSDCQPIDSLVADEVYELPRDKAALSLWEVPPIDMLVLENQSTQDGLNDYRTASGPTNFPPIPLIPGAVVNFVQFDRQAPVSPTAPGVQLVGGDEIGPLEPLPADAAIDPKNGVLSYTGTDAAVLVHVEGTREIPLDRTPVAGTGTGSGTGANLMAGAGIDLTNNVISATDYTDAEIDAFLASKPSRQELTDMLATVYTKAQADTRYGQLAIENTWQRDQLHDGDAIFSSSYLPLRVRISAFGVYVSNKGPIAVTLGTNAVQWSDGSVSARLALTGGKLVFSGAEVEAPDPTTPQGLATAAYVDRKISAALGAGTGGGTGQPVADPSLSFPYNALAGTNATTSWDVAGKRHAAAYVELTVNTTLALANGADGFVGTLLVVNATLNPLTCALPAGSFGPKNYQGTLAAGERRMLTATYAAGNWYFNSAIYYPQ
jgi:hypothetical protein